MPLLVTKLHIPPPHPQLVTRPRLIERLQEGLKYPLVLVSAPAGYGKTTLVNEWIRLIQTQTPTAWLSLEEADNDPVRFWDYFITALQKILPSIGETALRLLHSPEQVPTESFLVHLINDINALTGNIVFVLDDYHFILESTIHQSLIFLLEHMPLAMHLVIATRIDPPLPLIHFRGKGTLLEIGADDLKFSPEEAGRLFTALRTQFLSPENIYALHNKTEGWVVGLKMAAFSLRGETDVPAFLAGFTGTQRFIMDYLIEEVLQHQPPEIQDFLKQTSVFDRFCGSLCDAVTGYKNSRDILDKLARENLFTVALDKKREWYRYEHLFMDLLRHRFEVEYGTQAVAELQKKASFWFENNGLKEEAVKYTMAAHDWARALPLILGLAPNLIESYGTHTVCSWLHSLPLEILLTDLRTCRYYAAALVNENQYEAANNFVDLLEKKEGGNIRSAGYIAAMRTANMSVQQDDHIVDYARKALLLLPEDEYADRAHTALYLGEYYLWQGRWGEGEKYVTQAYELFLKSDMVLTASTMLTLLAYTEFFRSGKLYKAEEMFQKAFLMAEPYFEHAFVYSMLGFIHFERNELETAAKEINKAISLKAGNQPWLKCSFYLNKIPILLIQGDIKGAEDAFYESEQEMKPLIAQDPDVFSHAASHIVYTVCYRAVIAEAKGDYVMVFHWLVEFMEYKDLLPDYLTSIIPLLLKRGGDAGRTHIKLLFENARKAGLGYYLLSEHIYHAVTAASPEKALDYLSRALAFGKPEGYIRTFIDWGMMLAPLLRQAIIHDIEPEYARKLLDIIESEERRRKLGQGKMQTSGASAGLLSDREMAVLRLLVEDLSNREISEKLMISLSTAKTHVRHILNKLDAKDRLSAVVRAKELKLL